MTHARVPSQLLRSLQRAALRTARTREEADDLVQDALVAVLEQQRDWDEGRVVAWACGAIRRRAVFIARSAGRRRRREAQHAVERAALPDADARLPTPFIDALPPSLRTIALLANAGLGRAEIAQLLGIADPALRKRISDLRKAWRAARTVVERSAPALRQRPPCGLRRRSLRAALLRLPAARLAITDPDGHEIFLGPAHGMPTHGN